MCTSSEKLPPTRPAGHLEIDAALVIGGAFDQAWLFSTILQAGSVSVPCSNRMNFLRVRPPIFGTSIAFGTFREIS
jgi:hypothetical protein